MFTLTSRSLCRFKNSAAQSGSVLLLCMLALVASVSAQAAGKIAVIDLSLAVMQTDAAQQRFEEFKKKKDISQNIKSLESDRKAYKKAVEKYEKDRAVMSDSKKREAVASLREMEEDLQHTGAQIQKASQIFQQQLFQEFAKDALQVADNIVKEQSIGLLLDKERGGVLHATADYDITNQVTERLNKLK